MTESILCIKRELLPHSWVSRRSVIPMTLERFVNQCSQSGFEFVERSLAEEDDSLKQIIPYIVLQTKDLSKTAIYSRRGSEKRLHDLWSAGIGGHINPVDMDESKHSFGEILTTGMERELNEELIRRHASDIPVFEGIISEDITDVGKVHFGAVFRILTQNPDHYRPGDELFDFQWMETSKVETLNLELWSILAMELLNKKS